MNIKPRTPVDAAKAGLAATVIKCCKVLHEEVDALAVHSAGHFEVVLVLAAALVVHLEVDLAARQLAL